MALDSGALRGMRKETYRTPTPPPPPARPIPTSHPHIQQAMSILRTVGGKDPDPELKDALKVLLAPQDVITSALVRVSSAPPVPPPEHSGDKLWFSTREKLTGQHTNLYVKGAICLVVWPLILWMVSENMKLSCEYPFLSTAVIVLVILDVLTYAFTWHCTFKMCVRRECGVWHKLSESLRVVEWIEIEKEGKKERKKERKGERERETERERER